MVSFNTLIAVALSYAAFLFIVAFAAERRAGQGHDRWIRSPLIYTLSLSIYCTAWTFYGAVGNAARSGFEFMTIYLGPTLVLVGWWWILRKLVRIGRTQRITSIADLISSRFGKSTYLGVIVTLMAVAAAVPYIALQLQSVTASVAVFADGSGRNWQTEDFYRAALWVAAGLALFTVLFGTRKLDAGERHHGIIMAIAVEAVVKLGALLAVGAFVVWGLAGGIGETLARIDASDVSHWRQPADRWVTLTFLSAAAFLCLPRMFHVLVVENADERNLATASWAFPAYLLLMTLPILPIAVLGRDLLPPGSDPDLFVLTIPLAEGRDGLAMLSFLGGFSSATSMVIVATIALATMVSNHIVVPIWLSARGEGAVVSGDVRNVILLSRRLSIGGTIALGYLYFRFSGGGAALSAIGLISFVGVSQVLPAMLAGLFWRGATGRGAAAGLVIGFAIWAWTMFLPSIGPGSVIGAQVMAEGPLGIGWLRPQALFGIEGLDPVVHAVFWSLLLNSVAIFVVSVLTFPNPMERMQGVQFVSILEHSAATRARTRSGAGAEDLLIMTQRIIGPREAQAMFQAEAARQGKSGYLPEVTSEFLDEIERTLAGSVGAATAHAMVGQLAVGASVSVEDLIAVADETAQIMEYSNQLEAKSREQERTASALREANRKLTDLSIQKDAFLSQISHELRTPMTSIRSFSELLREGDVPVQDRARFAGIIHEEARRLTRLLDDILDLSVLENGRVNLNVRSGNLRDLIDQAVTAAGVGTALAIERDPAREEKVTLETDLDRLSQVFINVISNAGKYCSAEAPVLSIRVHRLGDGGTAVDFVDNGAGVPEESQQMIFEKFARITDDSRAGGAGLGLAICREIMKRLGGDIQYLPGQDGAAFRVLLPRAEALAAQ